MDYKHLLTTVQTAHAIRRRVVLQSIEGPAEPVFPPTYLGDGNKPTYAANRRLVDGEQLETHLLDSVQSQANRLEHALQTAIDDGRVAVPHLVLDFGDSAVAELGTLTSLQAPHRITDGYFRFAETMDGSKFQDSPVGKAVACVTPFNATPVYEICPVSLLLGFWDSHAGSEGARFPRLLTSRITAMETVPCVRTGGRIDPIFTGTTDSKAFTKGEKDVKASEVGLGNVPPSVTPTGGVTMSYAVQTTALALAGLRALRFPVDGERTPKRDEAARAVLACLSLVMLELQTEEGYMLRSGCALAPTEEPQYETIPGDGFTLSAEDAIALLNQAIAESRELGLSWGEPVHMKPGEQLIKWLSTRLEG